MTLTLTQDLNGKTGLLQQNHIGGGFASLFFIQYFSHCRFCRVLSPALFQARYYAYRQWQLHSGDFQNE